MFHDGEWRLLEPAGPAGRDVVGYGWTYGAEHRLMAANLAPGRARCHLPWDSPTLAGHAWELRDLLTGRRATRDGGTLRDPGLHLDMGGYECCLFRLDPASPRG